MLQAAVLTPLQMLSRVAIRETKSPHTSERKVESDEDEAISDYLCSQSPFVKPPPPPPSIARAREVEQYARLPEDVSKAAYDRLDLTLKQLNAPAPFNDARMFSAFLSARKAILYGNMARFCIQGIGGFNDIDIMLPEGMRYSDEVDPVHYTMLNSAVISAPQMRGLGCVVHYSTFAFKQNPSFCLDMVNVKSEDGDLIRHVIRMADFDLFSLCYDGQYWYRPARMLLSVLNSNKLAYNVTRLKRQFDLEEMRTRAQRVRSCGLEPPTEEEKFQVIRTLLPCFPTDPIRFWNYLTSWQRNAEILEFAPLRATWPTPSIIAQGYYKASSERLRHIVK